MSTHLSPPLLRVLRRFRLPRRPRCDVPEPITIYLLPDDVLVQIFEFYLITLHGGRRIERWRLLARVCRRWRSVIFQSPRRLNLRLVCSPKTRARDILDIWPAFPLVIRDVDDMYVYDSDDERPGVENILAALEHTERVCQIELINSEELGYLTASEAMQKPFPDLTDLRLAGFGLVLEESIPDSFLGGTTPRLRSLILDRVAFPGLPKLLLSASSHLIYLYLHDIPRSGHIPPEALATSLTALTNLESLHLHFRYPRHRLAPGSRRPPPLTRSILPRLTKINFKGDSEYLEEILARIDAPRLNELHITFFNQIIFDTPQLFQFVKQSPTPRAPEKGHIVFNSKVVIVKFLSHTSNNDVLCIKIPCTASEWQLSSLKQVCSSSLPPVSTLEDLHIFEDQVNPPRWQDDVENTLWLELLHPFVAVKNLYLCEELVPRVAPALQETVGGRAPEVLPALEGIFLEGFRPSGPLHKGIEEFLAARRLTGHPVTVYDW